MTDSDTEKGISYYQIGSAEMKPNVYGGESLEEHVPEWECYMEGDMDSEKGMPTVDFPASVYPAGTIIRIEVPECPNCNTPAEQGINICSGCEEFDWVEWTNEQYS